VVKFIAETARKFHHKKHLILPKDLNYLIAAFRNVARNFMSNHSTDRSSTPLTVTIKTACTLSGIGQTKMFQFIKEGRLEVIRLDGRTLISFPSLQRLLTPSSEKPAPRKRGRPAKVRPAGHTVSGRAAAGAR
jgi:hypothetical protein